MDIKRASAHNIADRVNTGKVFLLMNHMQMDLREPADLHIVDCCREEEPASGSDITSSTNARDFHGGLDSELESLTIEQTATILGTTVEKVKLLIDNNILCSGEALNGQPTLIAACVRAQAGKSKNSFMKEVKKLISRETGKRLRVPAAAPPSGEMSIQELFDDLASVNLEEKAVVFPQAQARLQRGSDILVEEVSQDSSKSVFVEGIDREQVTAKNLDSLLDNLDFANIRLEGAMYRVGFLESKIATLEEQLEELPQLRAKFARFLILERENADYAAEIARHQAEAEGFKKEICQHQSEKTEYLKTIAKQDTELLEMHSLLDRIRNSWWCRLWCWLTGNALK